MIASPVRVAAATTAIAALLAACSPPAEEPAPAPMPETIPAPTTTDIRAVSYACESGRTVAVRYPDAQSAVLTYDGLAGIEKLLARRTGLTRNAEA